MSMRSCLTTSYLAEELLPEAALLPTQADLTDTDFRLTVRAGGSGPVEQRFRASPGILTIYISPVPLSSTFQTNSSAWK